MKKMVLVLGFFCFFGCNGCGGVTAAEVVPVIVDIATTAAGLISQIETNVIPLFKTDIAECEELLNKLKDKDEVDAKEMNGVVALCSALNDTYEEIIADYDLLKNGDESQDTLDKTQVDLKQFNTDEPNVKTMLKGY